MLSRRVLNRTVGRMRENSPLHCCISPPVRRLVCGLVLVLPCRRKTLFIFLFGRTLRNRCFNLFKVYTYCSELIIKPLSKNSAP
jgi:hypothetical protein